MRINSKSQDILTVNGKIIEQVVQFQYLGCIVSKNGGTEADVDQRIRKARGVFAQLRPIWSSQELRRKTKLRIFETNVKSVLLYGSETWKATKVVSQKLQVFINNCLKKILRIYWPQRIKMKIFGENADKHRLLKLSKKKKN